MQTRVHASRTPTILYVDYLHKDGINRRRLDGLRRYAATHKWRVATLEHGVCSPSALREAEREERRRRWENETDEQREERRREFQARMREHSAKRLAAFVDNVGLDEDGCVALEGELNTLDAKVREIAEDFAAAIGEGVPFNFETQMQLFNEMSSAVLDAYAGLDETMPDGWREKDSEFNVWLGIGPDAADPLFDALRKVGIRAPFMGPPPR